MFLHYFNKKENEDEKTAKSIYRYIILNVRQIIENKDLSIKKDFNSSFELVSILLFIVFSNYKNKSNYKKINQILMNIYIADIDKSLREEGIGDMSIGKYVKSYVRKMYYRFDKLEKIFFKKNFDDFLKYIIKIDIQDNNNKSPKLSKYLFDLIINLSKIAKKEDLSDFKLNIINN